MLNFPDFIPGRFSVEEFIGRIVRREVIWNLQESAPYRIPRLPQLTTGMRMLSRKTNSLGCRKKKIILHENDNSYVKKYCFNTVHKTNALE